jgi:hypothetical protein
MERVTIRRFDHGQDIHHVDVRGHGYRWLYYALVGEEGTTAYMTDGNDYVQVVEEDAWFESYKIAIVLTGSPAGAVDLTCERVRHRMLDIGDWNPIP